MTDRFLMIADYLGITPDEVGRMTAGQVRATLAKVAFEALATRIVADNADHLLNDGAAVQITRAVERLERFHATTPLTPVAGVVIDLAGFGEAPVHFTRDDDNYLLLSQVASALGMPIWKACEWVRRQHLWAIQDQRQADEERGDGQLGWDLLRDYCDLQLDFITDNPEANPDAAGRRWSSYGDWLISHARLSALILVSPWSQEFMNNTMPAFGHAVHRIWGDKLKDIPTYRPDGTPTGGNAYDDLFPGGGLTEDQALRRARRGPALPDDEEV